MPHVVLDSEAYRQATYPAKALLLEFARQLNGSNNGHLKVSVSWLRDRGWNSNDVIQRAKRNLLDLGLVQETRAGSILIGPSFYAVSWLPITNFDGLSILRSDYWPGKYAAKNKPPIPRGGSFHPGARNGVEPVGGIGERPVEPPTGSIQPDLARSSIPPTGNNLNVPLPRRSLIRPKPRQENEHD